MEEKSFLQQKIEEFNDLNEAYVYGEISSKFFELKEVAKNIAISNGFLEIDHETDSSLNVKVLLNGATKGRFFMQYDAFHEQITIMLTPSLYSGKKETFTQKFYSENVMSFEPESNLLKEEPILANTKGIEEMFALLLSKMIELAYEKSETGQRF